MSVCSYIALLAPHVMSNVCHVSGMPGPPQTYMVSNTAKLVVQLNEFTTLGIVLLSSDRVQYEHPTGFP